MTRLDEAVARALRRPPNSPDRDFSDLRIALQADAARDDTTDLNESAFS